MRLSDEQRLLVSTARQFVTNELAPLEKEVEKADRLADDVARSITRKAREAGLYAANIPVEYGGSGLCALDNTLIEEEFGRTSDILARRALGGVYEMLLELSDEQKERWLLPSVSGDRVAAVGFTEPGGGSDAAGIKTRARKAGSGWRLSGQKCFISDGGYADYFVVTAVTDPDAGARGISLFLVDKGMPGFTVSANQPMMGSRGTSHVDLFFDDVELEPIHLIGKEGGGLKLMLGSMGRIRIMHVGARSVGKATRLFELMVGYAQERTQFGQPIGNYQLIQQMIADSAVEIEATRLLVRQAADDLDHAVDARDRISLLKVYASEMLGRVADRAVQMFGGMGYAKDHIVEKIYRDARLYRIIDGTSEVHRTVVGRNLVANGPGLVDPLR
ncbi:MAG: acyl-CoA dehydrogenase family protein [Rhizobiaceae bacterium]